MPPKPYLELTYQGQVRRLRRMAHLALKRFGIERPEALRLLFHGENTTFEVRERAQRYVLRIHRPGYQPAPHIRSELLWLEALGREAELRVPRPRRGLDGEHVQTIACEGVPEARHVVLFEWVGGAFQKKRRTPSYFRAVGRLCAALHEHAEAWTPPEGFIRRRLDEDGLLSERGVWGDPRQIEALTPAQRELTAGCVEALRARLVDFGATPDRFGLIHADLHTGNVLLSGGEAHAIDFDDAAFSWHAYDACVCLQHDWGSPDRARFIEAWLRGYRERRRFGEAQVEMLGDFFIVRTLMIMSWLDQRSDNPKLRQILADRLPVFIERLAGYLGSR